MAVEWVAITAIGAMATWAAASVAVDPRVRQGVRLRLLTIVVDLVQLKPRSRVAKPGLSMCARRKRGQPAFDGKRGQLAFAD